MDDLHIVTVATESKYYFPYLVESCRKYGKELEVLGYGEKWKGFNWRFKLMIEYLENLNPNDIVCFIDGYDVICTRNLYEIKDVFLNLYNVKKCKIIVGYDNIKYTNFLNKFFVKNYFGTCKNISLNAGTYIGYVKDLLEIIQKLLNINNDDKADDQQLLTNFCNSNDSLFYIDVSNDIFLTIGHPLHEIDNIINIDENKKISYNKKFPFFLHAPGATYLDNTIKQLSGYNEYIDINKTIKHKYGLIHIIVIKYPILLIILFIFIFSIIILKILKISKF